MSGGRFTTWLGEGEREALRALAQDLNMSENFVVRLALRSVLFGKAVPEYVQQASDRLQGNASDTSNHSQHVTGART